MKFDIENVLNSIFQDGKKELDNLYSKKEETHSEYVKTYSPAVAEQKWSGLQDHYKSCKESIVRSRIRKVTEALQPVRDYWDESLSEYDPVLVERVSGIAALAATETEYSAAARLAGNDYWALIALNEKAPDTFKNKVSRPDVEQYRFILDTLENRIERTLVNYEGSGTFIDSAAQIANVAVQNMPTTINQALEKIDSLCPVFFSFNMYAAGEALTPAEKERIAVLAETEFTGPACDPKNIGNSVCNYIEAHPEDKNMVMRSKYGPIAAAYEKEFSEARRINRTNRQVHNVVVTLKK